MGGVPIPTRGIHCGTLYMYVLCGPTPGNYICRTSSFISVQLSVSIHQCPFISVHISVSIHQCPFISVHLSVSIYQCPYISVHSSVSIYQCPFISVHLSVSIYQCPFISIHLSVSIHQCPFISVNSMFMSVHSRIETGEGNYFMSLVRDQVQKKFKHEKRFPLT